MKITLDVFEAYIKCRTKCWLRATDEPSVGGSYAEWVKAQNRAYRVSETRRLVAEFPNNEVALSADMKGLKAAKWRLASTLVVQAQMDSYALESELHALERVPAAGRAKPTRFIPIRFVFTNKLSKDDKLLLSFDAFVLSKSLGREVSIGKIVHGDDHATLKLKTSAMISEVRKRLERIATLLSNPAPPDLILNPHCPECEFQASCRQAAEKKDDLSLLPNMSAKERKQFHSKGLFTVTQLSYTFRARRRPKRLAGKREKYHHSLKALAIREQKIHIVGSPELKIESTPVYLDVEGLPDRDFYYLIGVLIGNGESAVQHSLWADTPKEEEKIWMQFLGILETVDNPKLIHYGSYETIFLKQMLCRYGVPAQDSAVLAAINKPLNLVSAVFAQLYFPVLSNSLKEIACWLGAERSDSTCSGLDCIVQRCTWEEHRSALIRNKLVIYNAEDCLALKLLVDEVTACICESRDCGAQSSDKIVKADSLKRDLPHHLGKIKFVVPTFEQINKTAYWDYQRVKIQARSTKLPTFSRDYKRPNVSKIQQFNKTIESRSITSCPNCAYSKIFKTAKITKTVRDLKFGRTGVKRWIVNYIGHHYRCRVCGATFSDRSPEWPQHSEGAGLLAYVVYQLIELRISHRAVDRSLTDLFGMRLPRTVVNRLKSRAAKIYSETCEAMLVKLVGGNVLHVDETPIILEGVQEYAWVFCNVNRIVFWRTETREGHFLNELLQDYNGVLVSDFYPAYDSIQCPKQKCLVHLMRDLNNDLLKEPFNDELKAQAQEFGDLLKRIVETIDRFGLRARYLRKHGQDVARFFRRLSSQVYRTETAARYQRRFEKNRQTLFTFIEHDDVPWHNNTAEHAIKALAVLRKGIGGISTQGGTDDYLILLSICETCKCHGVRFLDFLRSGEKDVQAFAENSRGRRRRSWQLRRSGAEKRFKRPGCQSEAIRHS
jgi:predicted RecB family nuclease